MAKKKSVERNPSLLREVWKASLSDKSAIFLMLFLDASFLVALFLIGALIKVLAPALDPSVLFEVGISQLWYALAVAILYALLLLFLYSLVKYAILRSVRSLFVSSPSESGLGGFFALNLLLLIVFGALYGVLIVLISSAKQPYAAGMFLLLTIPYCIGAFIVLNASQSIFHAKGGVVLRSLAEGFSFLFRRFSAYRKVAGISVVFILAYIILLFLIGFGIRSVADSNYALYLSLYSFFSWMVIVLSTLIGYLVLLFNRIGFYHIVQEEDKDDSPRS
jgi:hypothetical protein